MLKAQRAAAESSKRTISPVGGRWLVGLVVLGSALQTARLEAYIDPGTGSYLFQLAIGGALAGLYAVKRYWRRILDFLGSLRNKSHAGTHRGSARDRGTRD
jgi:hypothetical protein